jgi:YrbI family 3-deoxy-D-manno-octulosonate 8-phosphate phosphatase
MKRSLEDRLKDIKLVVMDFDGVLTDNKVITYSDGKESVVCDKSDSMGIVLLKEAGIDLLVLTSEQHESVRQRCNKLDIPYHAEGKKSKLEILINHFSRYHMSSEVIAYIGNDVNDLECMKAAGISVCPADAHHDVSLIADIWLESNGGNGAVREFADMLLTAKAGQGVVTTEDSRILAYDYSTPPMYKCEDGKIEKIEESDIARQIEIGDRMVGDDWPPFIIAEIGINHNGDVNKAIKLIKMASLCGCDAVKFQMRTPNLCVPDDQKDRIVNTPWGDMAYIDYKHKIELKADDYRKIDIACRELDIMWSASCWDWKSLSRLRSDYEVPFHKIPSAIITHLGLLEDYENITEEPIILSTGMSTLEEIDTAVEILGTDRLILLHCNSSYPADNNELNLKCMQTLRDRYKCLVGYSGHERGITPSIVAASMGACVIERHITLDRTMWGSDHAASLELPGLQRMVRDIKSIKDVMGDGQKVVYPSEQEKKETLRG